MKNLLLLVFLVPFLAFADNMDGYSGAKWGDNKTKVKKIVEETRSKDGLHLEKETNDLLIYGVEGDPTVIHNFMFFNGGLGIGQFYWFEYTKADSSAIQDCSGLGDLKACLHAYLFVCAENLFSNSSVNWSGKHGAPYLSHKASMREVDSGKKYYQAWKDSFGVCVMELRPQNLGYVFIVTCANKNISGKIIPK